MGKQNEKWADFKAKSSSLNVTIPNMGDADLRADLSRAAYGKHPININGVSLGKIADKFNQFKTDEDVTNFLEKFILRDFIGSAEEKENAIEYLKKSFHQGGLLYPVSSALATQLKTVNGTIACTLSDNFRDSLVNIKTTKYGFKIQEYSAANALMPMVDSLLKYTSDGRIHPEQGKSSVIKAEATIAIDFSKNSTNPSLVVESNHMEILHEGLKSHLDHRSLGQKLVDFFKDIFGLNKVKNISPQISDEVTKKSENTDDYNDENRMTL